MRFNTALLHGAYGPEEKTGATTIPIYQSTSFQHKSAEELENVFRGAEFGYVYTRINNPTILALEKRIAYLEKGLGAVACASGMAAITQALLSILTSGAEILSGSGIYGGTVSLFKELQNYGISTRYVTENALESFTAGLNEKTRLIYIESIGNPKLDVPDITALAELAHAHAIPLVVDNTAATPYLVRPIELGADIVIHSTSKYINGSGNSLGGMVVYGGKLNWDSGKFPGLAEYKKFGPFTYLAKLRKAMLTDFGGCMSPFNAYLQSIGLETLSIRMDRICANAQGLAEYLRSEAKVLEVNYPGLEGAPGFSMAQKQFQGKGGGILTVRLGSKKKAFALINNLQFAANLANIGDVRTLVIHPASTICQNNSSEERELMGVYEDLVRISVGIEDIEDLIADFQQALAQL